MNRGLLICLMFFLHFLSKGQSIQVSNFTSDNSGYDEWMVAGYTSRGVFVLQSNLPFESDRDRIGFKNRKYRLSFFNQQLNRNWYLNIESDPQSTVQGVYFIKDKMMSVISSVTRTAAQQQADIRIQLFDENGNKSEHIRVGVINLSASPEKIRVVTSENKRLTAILLPEFIQDEKFRVHFLLLDSAFNLMSSKALDVGCQRKSFLPEDFQLSDNGDLALISVQQVRENKKRMDEYKVHFCSLASSEFKTLVISREKEETAGAGIIFDNLNGMLLCAGFTAEPSLASQTSVFIKRIPVLHPENAVQQIIPVDDRYKFKLASVSERGSYSGLFSYPIRNIILRRDGGIVLIAEAFYAYEYSYYDYFTQSYMRRIDYQFNNIVSISIHPDGQIHWLNVIRKTQESTDDAGVFSSFLQMTTDSDLIMIYNNFGKRDNEILYSVIDVSGRFTESKSIRCDLPVILLPRFGKQVSANEAFIPCLNKKKLTLAKVVF